MYTKMLWELTAQPHNPTSDPTVVSNCGVSIWTNQKSFPISRSIFVTAFLLCTEWCAKLPLSTHEPSETDGLEHTASFIGRSCPSGSIGNIPLYIQCISRRCVHPGAYVRGPGWMECRRSQTVEACRTNRARRTGTPSIRPFEHRHASQADFGTGQNTV